MKKLTIFLFMLFNIVTNINAQKKYQDSILFKLSDLYDTNKIYYQKDDIQYDYYNTKEYKKYLNQYIYYDKSLSRELTKLKTGNIEDKYFSIMYKDWNPINNPYNYVKVSEFDKIKYNSFKVIDGILVKTFLNDHLYLLISTGDEYLDSIWINITYHSNVFIVESYLKSKEYFEKLYKGDKFYYTTHGWGGRTIKDCYTNKEFYITLLHEFECYKIESIKNKITLKEELYVILKDENDNFIKYEVSDFIKQIESSSSLSYNMSSSVIEIRTIGQEIYVHYNYPLLNQDTYKSLLKTYDRQSLEYIFTFRKPFIGLKKEFAIKILGSPYRMSVEKNQNSILYFEIRRDRNWLENYKVTFDVNNKAIEIEHIKNE
jgi:hypothetical protein